jgi:hypothetical protein
VTLGGSLATRTGAPVELVITVDLANGPNWAQFVPTLARIDVIRGAVTGPVADAETFVAPDTSVVKSFEVNRATGTVSFTYDLGPVDRPCYVRLRGTDGHRSAPGLRGAAVDPAGPAVDVVGSADPWRISGSTPTRCGSSRVEGRHPGRRRAARRVRSPCASSPHRCAHHPGGQVRDEMHGWLRQFEAVELGEELVDHDLDRQPATA